MTFWIKAYLKRCLGIVMLAHLSLSPLSGQELPTGEELHAHLNAYHQDFSNFRIRYRAEWDDSTVIHYTDYLITADRDYLVQTELHMPGHVSKKQIRGGNDKYKFWANYLQTEEETEWKLEAVNEEQRLYSHVDYDKSITPLMLRFKPHHAKWIDEHAGAEASQILAWEEIEGEPCIKVQTFENASQADPNSEPRGNYIWYAVEKDYLIRKTEAYRPGQISPLEYHCTEFAHDGVRWFPRRGYLQTGSEQGVWEVLAFEVNQSIPYSTFIPPPPPPHQQPKPRPRTREATPEADPPPADNAIFLLVSTALLSLITVILLAYFKKK